MRDFIKTSYFLSIRAVSEQYVQYPVGLVFCQPNLRGPKCDYRLSTGSYICESCANPAKPGLGERSLGTMELPLRPPFVVAVTFADLRTNKPQAL